MNNWKARKLVKIPIYFVTIIALFVAISAGAWLLIGYDNGTFTTSNYEASRDCESRINSQLWQTLSMLNNSVSWAENQVIDGETDIYTPEIQEEVDVLAAENLQNLLVDFSISYSVDSSNLQLKIVDVKNDTVLLDTFEAGDYGPLFEKRDGNYTVYGALQDPLSVSDGFADDAVMFYQFKSVFPYIWYVFATALALSIVGLGLVATCAGHKKGKEGITLGFWEKIPTDIGLVLMVGLVTGGVAAGVSFGYQGWSQQSDVAYWMGMTALAVACLLVATSALAVSVGTLAVRVKTASFFTNTFVCWAWNTLKKFVHWVGKSLFHIPTVWRALVIGLAVLLVNGILGMISMLGFFGWVLFAFYNFLMLLAICAIAWQIKLLQTGAETLAKGNFSEKIDTSNLYFDCKQYGDTLNTIGDGIGLAVEETLKSQRMKTELITNVSHDIKTPLTSIVTCIELLQQSHTDDQHKEYLELLGRQSMRLKKLVEDLVEASKASTGNLAVDFQETDLVETVEQALGEYASRLEQANLTVVPTLPEECVVMADGKLLWRVLDNLLSNVCKYAMAGTRVYVTVTGGDRPEIAMKNISAQPLNMTAEELLERFVRGDQSRSSEGSGLGLNIAQSLMHLQNGSLNLYIDGDFVKVQLIFTT